MQPWPSKFNLDTTPVNCALKVYFETAFSSVRAFEVHLSGCPFAATEAGVTAGHE
jgi:hypothetical protein